MKIHLAQHYGLCFGVRDAIAEAERLAQEGPLTVLGELVHNPIVRDRLARQGVQEGSLDAGEIVGDPSTPLRLADPPSPASPHRLLGPPFHLRSAQDDSVEEGRAPRVMVTAHGASDATHARWREAGFAVADGTCPLVRHAHTQLRLLVERGFFPVVIGKCGHVEVQGLTGDFPGAFVLESAADLAGLPVSERYGVISQTTQPSDKVLALVEALRLARPESEVRFTDTVCQPTKNRQNALRKLINECDTMVVVGGRNSNNTLQLAAAASAAGLRVHHLERPEELRAEWFRGAVNVGLTAGTSTLKETVAAVQALLEEFAMQRADLVA